MPPGSWHELTPWKRRPLTIPPNSVDTWIRLVVWEVWMGMLLCVILTIGLSLIVTSPDRIVAFSDLTKCYQPPPVTLPCERIVYRGGMLNAAFTTLFGLMLMGAAAWFLWELWNAVEPKPITDDFLRLLNDSFGRDWRNPLTWPWARVLWAYGFTVVGATLTAGAGLIIWTLVASTDPVSAPTVRIETSQIFRLGR
jgi:hypothetical protein